MQRKLTQIVTINLGVFREVYAFVFLLEPGVMRFFEVHLHLFNVWQPQIAVNPEFPLPSSVYQTCSGRTMGIKNIDTLTVCLQILQRLQSYFIVTYWNEDKHITIDELFEIGSHNRVHEPGLPFESV